MSISLQRARNLVQLNQLCLRRVVVVVVDDDDDDDDVVPDQYGGNESTVHVLLYTKSWKNTGPV